MQQSQESNRRLLRAALPNLAPGYDDAAHDKAAERLARDMEPGFTPGPWQATKRGVNDEFVIRPASRPTFADGWVLAETKGNVPEDAANARLIAAAPDLYAALERLERSMQAVYGDADSHLSGAAGGEGDPKVIRSYVRAALARAKGGAA